MSPDAKLQTPRYDVCLHMSNIEYRCLPYFSVRNYSLQLSNLVS